MASKLPEATWYIHRRQKESCRTFSGTNFNFRISPTHLAHSVLCAVTLAWRDGASCSHPVYKQPSLLTLILDACHLIINNVLYNITGMD